MDFDLSIIIVNWNTKDLLRECLESIVRETVSLSYEVWVVDNASKDGSADMMRREFGSVHLIANEENVGFGRANNQAYAHCMGKYTLILNPDTVILNDAVGKMVDFMETNPNAGVAGPKAIHPDGEIQVSWANFPSLSRIWTNNVSWKAALSIFRPLKRLLKSEASYTDRGFTVADTLHTRRVDYLLGQFLLTRKAIVDQVGLFDEDVFMYEEESDFCYRVLKAGWETWFVPDAEIIHYERRSIDQLPNAYKIETDWTLRARAHFFRKHHGRMKMVLFYALTLLSSIFKLFMFSILYLVEVKKREYLRRKWTTHWYTARWFFIRGKKKGVPV